MDIFKCYTVEGTQIRNYISANKFDSITTIGTKPQVRTASLLLYPLYQDIIPQYDVAKHACPLGLSFIMQTQPDTSNTISNKAVCLCIDPSQWTISSLKHDNSVLLDPSGDNAVLLFAHAQQLWLKSRQTKGLYLTLDKNCKLCLLQLNAAQQALHAITAKAINPLAGQYQTNSLSSKLANKLQCSNAKKAKLDKLLT